MISALLTSLAWLAALLVVFLAVQRWLHRQIYALLWMITHHTNLSVGIFSLVFFPGILLHETSHFVMARLLGVRTRNFSLLPKLLPDGSLRLGYVDVAVSDVVREALIGMAPLLSGGAAVALTGIYLIPVAPLVELVNRGQWHLLLVALRSLPGLPDFWIWFYLVFTISSTMLPSASDRRAWLPIALPLLGIALLAVFAGAGPWMLEHLAPGLQTVLSALLMVLGISLAVHLALGLPVGLAAALLARLTGRH